MKRSANKENANVSLLTTHTFKTTRQIHSRPLPKVTDIENGLEDTGRGKGKLGQSERVALTYMHYRM